ncbi:MAG TPA: hypothetical protein VEX68_10000 [Bryobacteraceae bacterium]|nr:hypothetical protein [Bryobacteraceae bacterium]
MSSRNLFDMAHERLADAFSSSPAVNHQLHHFGSVIAIRFGFQRQLHGACNFPV